MSFISYSQNLEDVILHRAFKNIKKGFYIDVGANDPVEDSITKAFYDLGWRGINIEPQYEYYLSLKEQRPEDTNLHLAVSNTVDKIQLYISHIRGWSTTNQTIISDENSCYFDHTPITVEAKSLDTIVNQQSVKDIHFLKIDVEGSEKDVLESFSFSIMPWVIVVEAISPGTNEDVSKKWEHLILEKNYTMGYFDGINKFYISPEHLELLDAFKFPPNVLDDYIYYPLHITLQHNEDLEATINELSDQIKAKDEDIKRYMEFKKLYFNLINSHSWQITKPLRVTVQLIKSLLNKS